MSTSGKTSTSGKRTRGPYAKTKERREQILHTALEVFAEMGFRGASVREIADRVGLSEGGVLHHFGDKVALLESVLKERDAETIARFPSLGSGSLEELRALAALATYNQTQPRIVELFTILSAEATAADHPAHDFFVERSERIRGDAKRAFSEAQARGVLRSDADPRMAASTLISLMDGLQVQWLLDPRGIDMGAAMRAYIESVMTISLWEESPSASARARRPSTPSRRTSRG